MLPALCRPKGASNIVVAFSREPKEGELATLTKQGADIFELRLDLAGCTDPTVAAAMASKFTNYPLIATDRSRLEGGNGGDDNQRLTLLAATTTYANAIDLELSSTSILNQVSQVVHGNNCELILSYHHFGATPKLAKLETLMQQAFQAGADIFKVACKVNDQQDLDTLTKLLIKAQSNNQRLAVMGMGESDLAKQSRSLLGLAGSQFVFAQTGEPTAPGQPNLAWLNQLLTGTNY